MRLENITNVNCKERLTKALQIFGYTSVLHRFLSSQFPVPFIVLLSLFAVPWIVYRARVTYNTW